MEQVFNQEMEQMRIMREMEDDTKPGRHGWRVLVVFIIIVGCLLYAFSASAQSLTFADKNVE